MRKVFKKWWFWTAIGGTTAIFIIIILLFVSSHRNPFLGKWYMPTDSGLMEFIFNKGGECTSRYVDGLIFDCQYSYDKHEIKINLTGEVHELEYKFIDSETMQLGLGNLYKKRSTANTKQALLETQQDNLVEDNSDAIDASVDNNKNDYSDSNASTSSMTLGQKNALKSAQSYLRYSAFSYSGLVEQLEYEKYSHDDAVYAVDHCGANWNEQAVKSAESYLKYSAFSRDSLIEQLEYEGFTHEQAVYGAEKNGY